MTQKKRKSPARNGKNGFSLPELLIVIVIVGILAGLAIPSINQFLGNTQISGTAGTLLSNIAYARAEAAKRGQNIVICPARVDNQQQITPQCTTGNSSPWIEGYLVYVERTGDTGQVDASESSTGDTILRKENIPQNISLKTTFSNHYLLVTPSGKINVAGSFELCKNGARKRQIQIKPAGMAISKITSENCS